MDYSKLIREASVDKKEKETRVAFRVSAQELASFKAACDAAGVVPSKLLRQFMRDFIAAQGEAINK